MIVHESASAKSAAMARRDKGTLLRSLDAAHALGAISPADAETISSDSPATDSDTFDPALDLPLGVEPVGALPRELMIRETDPSNDVLPKGVVLPTVVSAMTRAAASLGYPTFGVGYWISPPRKGRGSVRFSDRDTRPPSELPPFIRADLTGGDSRRQVTESLIDAVMKASRAPRHPERIFAEFVDDEREARWPELRARGRQTKGLRKRLGAASGESSSDHIGRWFCEMAPPIHLEAYDSGVPVSICGTASTESGYQVTWYVGDEPHGFPSLNLTTAGFKPKEVVENVIDLVLFAHAVDPDSDEGRTLGRHMWAAAVARLAPVPEAPPF